MNTPAHAIANLWVLGRGERPETAWPILAGSVLPDLPMFLFYAYQKVGVGVAEAEIWTHAYHQPAWQAFFDLFNSLPLIGLAALVAWAARSPRWIALFASMALHVLGDLPLHHDDAHRHFFPFSDWRFASPVSYWDPAHFGWITAPVEAAMVAVGSAMLLRRYPTGGVRRLVAIIAAIYLAYWVYVVVVWL